MIKELIKPVSVAEKPKLALDANSILAVKYDIITNNAEIVLTQKTGEEENEQIIISLTRSIG